MKTFDVSNYKIEIQKINEEDGGGYIATMPEIGCIADGETINEAVVELQELAKDFIKLAREDNIKIPIPKVYKSEPEYSGKLSLRIPKFLHKAIAKQAEEEGCSINHLLTSYISIGVGNEFGKKQSLDLDASYEFFEKIISQQWDKRTGSTFHTLDDFEQSGIMHQVQ